MRSGNLRWLSSSVTIAPFASDDSYGQPVYGTGVVTAARIVVGQKALIDDRGNTLISSCQVFVDGGSAANNASKITLPDGTSPTILQVKTVYDAVGTAFMKEIMT